MKRPSFLNNRRKNNGYELNTSTSSYSSDNPNKNNNSSKEKEVVLSSISVLCHESKSHTKKHNTNRSSNNSDVVSPHTVPSSSSSHHVEGGIVSSNNCGVGLSTKLADTNADELVLNSTTLLNNISLEDSYSTSEQGGKVLPSSVAVFVDDLILCGTSRNKQSEKKSTSVHQPMVIAKKVVEEEGEVSPTGVAEFNVSFGSADFDYFVGNRFTDLSANDNEQGNETEHEKEKKTSESSNKETNESINNEKTDNVRYTMVDNNKTSKGGKKARKKEGNNNNKSSLAEFSNTYNDDTFSISLASTTNNSNDTSSSYTRRASIESSASQQYINEHIQILLDTILLPTSMLPIPKSVKKEVSHTILPAFKSTANDVTDNIELILTLPADYIANALNTSTSTSNNDEMKKVDGSSSSSKMSVSSFMNSVNAGYISKSRNVVSKSSLLNESNISNETIKTSNLLLCGTSGGSSCIERDFLYNTCVDQ